MNDQRPCEMEYSRVAPEHVYVRDNTKESVAEKGRGGGGEEEKVEEEEMQDEEGGVPKGGKWLVGEDAGAGGRGAGGKEAEGAGGTTLRCPP